MGRIWQWGELTANPFEYTQYGRSVRLQRQLQLHIRPIGLPFTKSFRETSHPGKWPPGKRLFGKKTIRESNHPENDRIPSITVHKAQGLSLTNAIGDAGPASFGSGMIICCIVNSDKIRGTSSHWLWQDQDCVWPKYSYWVQQATQSVHTTSW